MASQSLYRKWRSQTFSDLIGQEAITRTLLNAVREGRLAHAYLFCGPRGTGKTSTARLLAKAVNCANPQNGEPCNECVSCREITAGRSPDVIEIDAASNTGVDNIRDLRETVNLLGSGGHYKVYVVDEVHMLSTAAFNALLKTLEEPPPHIIFVLATTEAHKVLATVVSRCQRFDFHRISMREIVARIQHVAAGEGLEIEPAAADLLARAAQGGMRDALSLLDQAMAYCGTQIDLQRTRAMLGLADPGAIRALIAHVAEQRAADGLYLINDLVTTGADLRQLNAQLAEEWRALVLARAGADVAQLMDRTDDEAREIAALAKAFSLEELTACARVFARNEAPARGLPVPQLALELAFLECLSIREHGGQPVAQQAQTAQLAQARPMVVAPATTQAPMPARSASIQASAPGVERGVPRVAAAQPSQVVEELDLDAIERGVALPPAAIRSTEPATAQTATAMPVEATEQMDGEPAAVDELFTDDWDGAAPAVDGTLGGEQEQAGWDAGPTEDWREALYRAQSRWDLVKQVCKQKSRSVAALLHSARPWQIEPASEPDETPVLVLQADFKFHYDKLREPTSRLAVEWAIAQVIEMPIRVRLVFNSAEGGGNAGGNGSGGSSGPGSLPGTNGPVGPTESFAPRAGRADSSPSNGHNGQRSVGSADAGLRAVASTGAPAIAPAATDNVRQFTTERGATNGNRRATAAAGEMREAAPGYDALLSNITPLRPSTRTAPRPASPDARTQHRLEDDVRADAVIQALMRTHGVELADVRPLNDDE
ncbi:MAG: DNA polymerase III subunit gamma/tau [Ktedonobacterales bacterium]